MSSTRKLEFVNLSLHSHTLGIGAISRLTAALFTLCLVLGGPLAAQTEKLDRAVAPPTADATTPSIDFQQLVESARTKNPEWAAAQVAVKAAQGELLQASMTPNPTIQVNSVVELPIRLESAGLSVSQVLELGGKRQARLEAATARLEAATQQAAETQRQLRYQLRQVYVQVIYAGSLQQLREQAVQLAEGTEKLTEGRLKAGDVAGVDLMQAQVEVSRRRSELAAAKGELVSQVVALNRLLGSPDKSELGFIPSQSLSSAVRVPELASLQSLAQNRPDLLLSRAQLNASQKEVRVQETHGISNLQASLGLTRENLLNNSRTLVAAGPPQNDSSARWTAGLSFSIPLPLNDTNEGNIQKAQALSQGAELNQEIARQKVQNEVLQAFVLWNAAVSALTPLEQSAVENALQAMRITDQSYRLGYRSLLNVLQSRQEYLELRKTQLEAHRNLELALARLEAAVGNPLGGDRP